MYEGDYFNYYTYTSSFIHFFLFPRMSYEVALIWINNEHSIGSRCLDQTWSSLARMKEVVWTTRNNRPITFCWLMLMVGSVYISPVVHAVFVLQIVLCLQERKPLLFTWRSTSWMSTTTHLAWRRLTILFGSLITDWSCPSSFKYKFASILFPILWNQVLP